MNTALFVFIALACVFVMVAALVGMFVLLKHADDKRDGPEPD